MGKALRMAESFVPPDSLFDFLSWCESIKSDAQDEWSDPLEASLWGGNKSMEQMREGAYGMVSAKLAWARAWNESLTKEERVKRCLRSLELQLKEGKGE